MHLAANLLIFAAALTAAPAPTHYRIVGGADAAWNSILDSAGFLPKPDANLIVVTEATKLAPLLAGNNIVIVIGEQPELGIKASSPAKPVRSVTDEHNPTLPIIWEQPVNLPTFDLPATARIFARDRWTNSPLLAGLTVGQASILWLAVGPGTKGHERFPYLPQALADLGVRSPFRSRNLWAFADSSYRLRADPDYLADRWRNSGIATLHLAAWHFWDADADQEAWLSRLLEACHRRAILVYAWLELPHVSEAFWQQHPEWREKTALLQDAHLDWRRLMNLQNPACRQAVAEGLNRLTTRFDWDGINLAELYFESLEGHTNAARFTPMNADVRSAFQSSYNFDPRDLFDPGSARHHTKDPQALRQFLDFRATLAHKLQQDWIAQLQTLRTRKPNLDIVLTHVDDRYDPHMRDLIGADAARLLPEANKHDITFLIEDPATLWHLGPERYTELAAKYEPITTKPRNLAIDINIVERYQDVYPTKQQTGVELLQLVHLASKAFPRVALYFENSLLAPDLPLIAAAAATPSRYEQIGGKLVVQSPHGIGIPWTGPALVNGQVWPYHDGHTLWLPAGSFAVQPSSINPPVRILDTSAEIRGVTPLPDGVEIAYTASARAIFLMDRPVIVAIDGAPVPQPPQTQLTLPRGQHLLQLRAAAPTPTD